MKIKPVNLNKTLKLLEGTEAEKPFIEDMLLYMDQAKEYEEKKVLQSNLYEEPRQPGGCKLKTAPVRPVVAARPAEYVCSEDLFY
ncbi:hypothetical protein [Escherichia coli]|uniref:hypothetical protein n=1 Tax=Escherichia coli TaxID=562 RepID=UPI00200E066B|nr:hypothetical protein [Escherichia coli]